MDRPRPVSQPSPTRSRRALVATVLLGALAITGCGYTFVGGARDPETAPRLRVDIRTFENKTSEPGAEFVMTTALRTELLDRPSMELVDKASDADWVIRGEVARISTRPEAFSSVVLALEQTLTMEIALEVRDREGEDLGLGRTAASAREVYLASADIEVSRKNRQEALRRVAGVIASRVGDALELEAIR